MELEGRRLIAADRLRVWARLNDPEVLKACLPGCTEFSPAGASHGAERFSVTVTRRIALITATFHGTITLSDVVPGERYRMTAEGKGGVAGMAAGAADVVLSDVPEGTDLSYRITMQTGGRVAQLGQRIVGGLARGMADAFFDRFAALVAPDAVAPDAPGRPGGGAKA